VAHFSAVGVVMSKFLAGTLTSIIFFLLWISSSWPSCSGAASWRPSTTSTSKPAAKDRGQVLKFEFSLDNILLIMAFFADDNSSPKRPGAGAEDDFKT